MFRNLDLFNHRFLINFTKYRYLLVELVKRDIKVKYRRSVLGIFWSLLNPLLTMIVLYVVFSTLFAKDTANYPIYLLTGRLIFSFFNTGSKAGMNSIRRNAGMLKKVYIPKYMYTLGKVLSEFVFFVISLVVLFGVMLVTHAPFTVYIIMSAIPILILLLFTFGVGLLLATLTVFFRDLAYLYGIFTMMLMWCSAIFYPITIVPAKWQFIFTLNPIYVIIAMCRDVFLYGQMYTLNNLIFATSAAVSVFFIGVLVFYKYQDRFILYL